MSHSYLDLDPRAPHLHRYELIWPDGHERKFHGCVICGQPADRGHPCDIEAQCAEARKRADAIMSGVIVAWIRQHPQS